ncbi:MAG: arginyl-tRNA synthetase [Solirubrobacteraceae bacterium]|jgi:arginyl-tRNA synthetase|nr:arginyl-tRNA synthetase [Solirubrobacteraceae bacterium]
MSTPVEELRSAVERASGASPTLERPKTARFGDFSTNAALLLAPRLGEPPRDVAERLGETLREELGDRLDRVEVAGPGFLNLFLADAWFRDALERILADESFGAGAPEVAERVLIEFVSANPTGPLTAAGGRHAAYGDSLARILSLAGHSVEREYYFNDAGAQIRLLGESIRARARGEAVPEGGYEGEYVAELVDALPDAAGADVDELSRAGVAVLIGQIQATLSRFGVEFDTWFREASLHEGDPSQVDVALSRLRESGAVYESDGAVWLRTTDFGDDKDRVLVRSSGEGTYFAADVAYHLNKLSREFDRLVNVLGADHHGYIGRMKGLFAALGADPEMLEVLIMQFVHIVEGGRRASMSKRRGEFVTLDELLDEIGVDATRFFMLQRSHDTTIDLDLDLAREESAENPVYYVQYAHARIASILEKAGTRSPSASVDVSLEPAERALVLKLLAFPGEVGEAAERRAPHRIATYALELAQEFTAFYRDCKVVGVEEDVEAFRLALCVASRRTIARALELLGVSAPESM